MIEKADRFRDAIDDFWDDDDTFEDASTDEASTEVLDALSPRYSGLAVMLVAVGLYLVGALSLKVWNLYVVIHTYEVISGVTLDHDIANLLTVAPDLEADLAMNARASAIASPNVSQVELATSERPEFHVVAPNSSLPREHDAVLGAIGLACVLVGSGSLSGRARRRFIAAPQSVAVRSAASSAKEGGRAVIGAWGFAQVLLVGVVALVLLTLAYHLVLSVIGGTPLSWELVDQMIDQIVSVAWP